MRNFKNALPLAFILSFSFGASGPAHAYLDPGTGTIIVQSVIGSVAAAATITGLYWGRLKDFFRRLTGKGATSEIEKRE